jgi:hypothetical protein
LWCHDILLDWEENHRYFRGKGKKYVFFLHCIQNTGILFNFLKRASLFTPLLLKTVEFNCLFDHGLCERIIIFIWS